MCPYYYGHKPVKQLESLQDQTEVQKVYIFCLSVGTPSKVHGLDLLPVQKGPSDCLCRCNYIL